MNASSKATQNNTPLDQLKVLAVDCQATSANANTGQLLEIGFMAGSAVRPIDVNDVRAHFIRQREDMAPPSSRKLGPVTLTFVAHASYRCLSNNGGGHHGC